MKFNLNDKIIDLNKKIINKFDYLKLLNETKNNVDKDDNNIIKINTDYKTFYGFILVNYFSDNRRKLLNYFDNNGLLKNSDNEMLLKIILSNINKKKLKKIANKFLFNDYLSLNNKEFYYLLKKKYSKIKIKRYSYYDHQIYDNISEEIILEKNKVKSFINEIFFSLKEKYHKKYKLSDFDKHIKKIKLIENELKKKNKGEKVYESFEHDYNAFVKKSYFEFVNGDHFILANIGGGECKSCRVYSGEKDDSFFIVKKKW